MNKLFKYKNILKLFGISLFIFILSKQDLNKVYSILLKSNFKLLFFSMVILPVTLFFRTIRFKSILTIFTGNKNKLTNLFKIYIESFFWGIITPGRLGELTRIFYISKYTVNKRQSIFIVLVDRSIDILLLFEIALLSLIYFSYITGHITINYMIVYSVTLTTIFVIFPSVIFFLKNIFFEKLKINLQSIIKNFKRFNTKKYFYWSFITVVAWAIYFLQIYLINLGLNIKLSYVYTIIIVSVSSMVALLPITIFGIGTRDITIITLLKQLGILEETGFTFSIMIFFITYINSMLCLLFINILKKKDNYIEK